MNEKLSTSSANPDNCKPKAMGGNLVSDQDIIGSFRSVEDPTDDLAQWLDYLRALSSYEELVHRVTPIQATEISLLPQDAHDSGPEISAVLYDKTNIEHGISNKLALIFVKLSGGKKSILGLFQEGEDVIAKLMVAAKRGGDTFFVTVPTTVEHFQERLDSEVEITARALRDNRTPHELVDARRG